MPQLLSSSIRSVLAARSVLPVIIFFILSSSSPSNQDVRCAANAMNALQGYVLFSSDRGGMRIEFAKNKMGETASNSSSIIGSNSAPEQTALSSYWEAEEAHSMDPLFWCSLNILNISTVNISGVRGWKEEEKKRETVSPPSLREVTFLFCPTTQEVMHFIQPFVRERNFFFRKRRGEQCVTTEIMQVKGKQFEEERTRLEKTELPVTPEWNNMMRRRKEFLFPF